MALAPAKVEASIRILRRLRKIISEAADTAQLPPKATSACLKALETLRARLCPPAPLQENKEVRVTNAARTQIGTALERVAKRRRVLAVLRESSAPLRAAQVAVHCDLPAAEVRPILRNLLGARAITSVVTPKGIVYQPLKQK